MNLAQFFDGSMIACWRNFKNKIWLDIYLDSDETI